MNEKNIKYAFFRGDILLGHIIPTHEDFPWQYGQFLPTNSFQKVSYLFEKELKLLKKTKGDETWENAYKEVINGGLCLELISTKEIITDFLIHIEGNIVWWR